MKNKGFTLVELMVSIALVSIVLVFMFNLLGDVKRESSLSNDNINDAINRSTITRIIQNEWIENKLVKVSTCGVNSTVLLCYNFTFKDNTTKNLIVRKNEIEYDDERWILEDGEYSTEGANYCFLSNGINYLLKITIPVLNHKDDNRIHDIELIRTGTDIIDVDAFSYC